MSNDDAERWQRLQTLFREASGLRPEARESFVREAAGHDALLRAQLERLLAAQNQSGALDRAPEVTEEMLAATARDALLGTCVGRFRITRRLGHGGMGTVYEAEQEHPHRTVALKLIRPGLASESIRRRFVREAELLGRLQHPGIAQIFDAGMHGEGEDAQPYFAMELIRGTSLGAWAVRPGIQRRRRIELVARIGDALHHAHERGIVHRDLKPDNIVVDDRDEPKILDFGVARVLDPDLAPMTHQTDVGQLVGTLPYMSPEQVSGDPGAVDVRSDVYALGVITHQLLCGAMPYEIAGKSMAEAARMIRDDEPTLLGAQVRSLRGDLEAIVAKALEKDPDRRYPTAAAFSADLRRYLAEEPVSARRITTLYQFRKFTRRNKVLAAGVAAVFVTLVLGVAGTGWKAMAESRERQRAEREVAKTRAINEILRALLISPDPFYGRGLDVTLGEAMQELTRRLDAGLVTEPEVEAEVRMNLGNSYRHMGALDRAAPHLDRALALRRELFGPGDPRTLEASLPLGYLRENQGDLDAAATMFREVVEKLEPGENDAMRIAAMTSLGRAYQNLGRVDEAATLLETAREQSHRQQGPEHGDTLYAQALLARALARQGRIDDALALVDQVLEIRERTNGVDHPSTLIACEIKAMILVDAGRHMQAEPWCRRAAEGLERAVGKAHQSTRRVRGELAEILTALGRVEEPEALDGDGP